MTLLRPAFKALGAGTNSAPTTLMPRRDILTTNDLLAPVYGSITIAHDYTATYEDIVRKQLWVRIAVNKLAYSIGRLPLKVYRKGTNGRERDDDSPLAMLLRRPNDSKATGFSAGFKARIAYDLFTFGNSIIVKVQRRPDQMPEQLVPFSPRGWNVDDNGDYIYRQDHTDERRFKPWQIVHLMEPGPTSSGFGQSRLEAARLTLAIEYAAQRLGAATFENGARPGGIINIKDGLPANPQAREAAVERFKSEIMRRFGGVDKAGLPAVLEGNVDWLSMSHNLNDAAVVSHRQLTRMEVASLYDIPQPAIGILDEANFASVDALHLMFYQDSLTWPLKLIEETLQAQLINGLAGFETAYAEFDLNAVMRGAFQTRMAGYQTGINAGIFTSDEVRGWENLPPMADDQPEAGLLRFPLNYSVAPSAPGQEAP